MSGAEVYEFGPFRVDATERLLWHAGNRVELKGKPFDVLLQLLESGGRALGKDALMSRVWPHVAVEESNLTVAISQLRKALRDADSEKEYVETLSGRGYRFWVQGQPVRAKSRRVTPHGLRVAGLPSEPGEASQWPGRIVGRQSELAALVRAADEVRAGAHRVVLISGEAGIGKSALVESFLETLDQGSTFIARSACVDSYGASEPYLPVLRALARLCRGANGTSVLAALQLAAPNWAVQLPHLLSPAELQEATRRSKNLSTPRLLRELAAAVDLIASRQPLVWCFEDLHWADESTLGLLTYLVRHDLSRTLLVGSYRPAENHDSCATLSALTVTSDSRGARKHLALAPFSLDHVQAYLCQRFPVNSYPAALAALVHQRSCGTPLFMVQWLDALLDGGFLKRREGAWTLTVGLAELATHLPESTVQTIEAQLDRLGQRERAILDAACVAGATFAVAAVADVLSEDAVALESVCLSWARQKRLLRAVGEAEWPDGTCTSVFGFAHALYQEVLYRRLGAASRARIHRKLGERMESAYGARSGELARELALHFERGSEPARAAQYLHLSAKVAAERCAHATAIEQLKRGLSHLESLEDGTRRQCIELDLQATLGSVLSKVLGHAALEVQIAYQRVRRLSDLLGGGPVDALFGAWMSLVMRGDYSGADELALQIAVRSGDQHDRPLAAASRVMLGLSAFYLGNLAVARRELEAGLEVLELEQRPPGSLLSVIDPKTMAHNLAWVLWMDGLPDSALLLIERGLASTSATTNPHGWAYLMHFASVLHQLRGEHVAARAKAEAMWPLCQKQELGFFIPLVRCQVALQVIHLGEVERGLADLEEGMAGLAQTGTGIAMTRPYALLAEALMLAGRLDEAAVALRTGFEFVVTKNERWWESELHRLQGELWLTLRGSGQDALGCDLGTSGADSAEACLLKSFEVARERGARSLLLRAAMSLGRLWSDSPHREQGRRILAEVLSSFTQGWDTADLRAATLLLRSLQ